MFDLVYPFAPNNHYKIFFIQWGLISKGYKNLRYLTLMNMIMLDCLSTEVTEGFNSFLKRSVNYFTLLNFHQFCHSFPPVFFTHCSLNVFPHISKVGILIFVIVLKTLSSNRCSECSIWIHQIDVHLCHLCLRSSTIFCQLVLFDQCPLVDVQSISHFI